ncbi:MAG: NAD-dependent protein deacetylase, SIR2 family protein [uncultured archaeon A07HN63]|nr:MAG: NAD-dependent protein deacetylase, SIR2 family protein [uncultured archaeon A07HN63]
MNGIWGDEFDPEAFHIRRFETDPVGFWEDRIRLREHMRPGAVEPNAAHKALARLEACGGLSAVITQNTDGLHSAAGSSGVLELHGNAQRVICHRCGERRDAEWAHEVATGSGDPPTCSCGGIYKPAVVLFGESLDPDSMSEARRLVAGSDVLLVAGTSLQVDPAASLPAQRQGATLAVINLETTPFTANADYDIREDVTDVLPKLANAVCG